MLQLSYAVNVTEKFWVLGYSGGSMHAWAALRYIPDRVAGMLPPLSLILLLLQRVYKGHETPLSLYMDLLIEMFFIS